MHYYSDIKINYLVYCIIIGIIPLLFIYLHLEVFVSPLLKLLLKLFFYVYFVAVANQLTLCHTSTIIHIDF